MENNISPFFIFYINTVFTRLFIIQAIPPNDKVVHDGVQCTTVQSVYFTTTKSTLYNHSLYNNFHQCTLAAANVLSFSLTLHDALNSHPHSPHLPLGRYFTLNISCLASYFVWLLYFYLWLFAWYILSSPFCFYFHNIL